MSLKDTENFVIDTRSVSNSMKGLQGWQYVELTDHPEYAQLCELALSKTLQDKFPRDDRRITHDASNYHTDRMMKETKPKFESDEDGLIFIKDEAMAKRILEILQKQDKEISLSKYGKQFNESSAESPSIKKK